MARGAPLHVEQRDLDDELCDRDLDELRDRADHVRDDQKVHVRRAVLVLGERVLAPQEVQHALPEIGRGVSD